MRRCPILHPYYVALRWCGQDCPDGEENDFRLVQCRQHYDSIPANGTVYTWQPYFPGSGGRSSYCYCSRASSYNVAKMSRLYDIIVSVYTCRPTVLTTDQTRPTDDRPLIWKISNGDISARGHPIHFMFGSGGIGFSVSANPMALFRVGPNTIKIC